MGFNMGSSDSQSQSSSIARQGVFFPSPEGISESMDVTKQYANLAQGFLDPYVTTGKDALNQMRLLTGMKPMDSLEGFNNRLARAMEDLSFGTGGLKIPLAALIDPGKGMGPGIGGITMTGETSSIENPQEEWNLGRFGDNRQRYLESQGYKSARKVLMDEVAKSRAAGDQSAKYAVPVFDAFTKVTASIGGILGSEDTQERSSLYESALEGFNALDAALQQQVSVARKGGSIFGSKGELGAQVAKSVKENPDAYLSVGSEGSSAGDFAKAKALIATLRGEFIRDFEAEAPRALTNEEIAQKVQQDPGYNFRFDQGMGALEKSMSARGLLKSGRLLKELEQYGQGLASQQYQQTLQNYAQMAGIGLPPTQQSSSQTLGVGSQLAQAVQDMNRQWFMSPWTQKAQSSSQSSSSNFGISL